MARTRDGGRKRVRRAFGALLLVAFGCSEAPNRSGEPRPAAVARPSRSESREPIAPLPAPAPLDTKLVALGRRLFHDTRLSSDGSVACVSCHDLAKAGSDGRPKPRGAQGRDGLVNTPSVFNASLNFVQFWDGRAASLEEQVNGPITNPVEMATSWPDVLGKLRADPSYVSAFGDAFPDGINESSVRRALAEFERTLLSRGSAFDRWLEGDENALSPEARAGYETFKAVGCIACHQGTNVGGNMFQRFGVLGDYFKDRGNVLDADYGRYNVTRNESDRFVFRVPSLRNVEHTAPYFHDGSAPTLERAVQVMAKYQLGRKLSDTQVREIIAFLRSLSGPGVFTQAAP